MMTRLRSLVSLAMIASSAACVDLDEELVGVLSSDFYETPEGLDAAVNGAYSQLRGFWGRQESMGLSQFGTDTWTNGDQGGEKFLNFYDAGLNSSHAWFRFPWNSFYRGINTSNTVIERAANIDGMDPAIRDVRIAEARFLRALQYFYLVQMYGDVPLNLTEIVGVQTEATRSPASEVYAQIITDLEAAIEVLPAVQPQFGRATRGAAQHLLAKVHLTRAYKDYGDPGDFARAAELAQEVINSGVYSLLPDYADLFCAPDTGTGACDLNGFNEQHSEIVFSIQFSHNVEEYENNTGNSLHLYFLSYYDDLPGMPRSLENGRAWRRLRPTPFLIGLFQRWATEPDENNPTPQVVDTRYDASFQSVWRATAAATGQNGLPLNPGDTAMWHPGFEVSDAVRASKAYVILTPSDFGELRYPTLKKHYDNLRPNFNEEDGGKDLPLARLGETYLIAAEALLGAGNRAEAAFYINEVRRRAAAPGMEAAMEITPADVTLDFILDERARELAGELHRWFDLVRVGTDKYLERVKAHNVQAAANIKEMHALRPIPQAQIDGTTASFAQNPGY